MIGLRWNLNDLYSSFVTEEFQNDLKGCDDLIRRITEWVEDHLKSTGDAAQKIEEYLHFLITFKNLSSRLIRYANLTFSVDSKNEQATRYLDIMRKKASQMTLPEVRFQKWLDRIQELDPVIRSSDFLKSHAFYLKELKEKARYLLTEKEEVAVSRLINTGSKAWNDLQDKITSNLMVDIEIQGKKKQLPLPMIRNLAFEKDKEVREKAYEAELRAYSRIEEISAACLNSIKGEVITLTELRGYSSPLDMTLKESRMDREILDVLLETIEESLPDFRRYLRKKAEILGHEGGLPFYDLFAPIGEADLSMSYKDAHRFIVDKFSSFNQKLASFADHAFKNQWIDAAPREGKMGGAFCYGIHAIGQSRILVNFNGSFKNVTTLAHELGHGYHQHCLKNETVLNIGYPMTLAETASTFCETIVANAALQTLPPKEAFSALEGVLCGYNQLIVDIYSRYLFETELFQRRKDAILSAKELKRMMMDAQKQAYGEGLDHTMLHPYMWVNKSHYYYAERNFYNFPYAFGQLFALGLYSEYLCQGEEFVSLYDRFLQGTGRMNVVDIAQQVGIDIRSKEFWRGSLSRIKEKIDSFVFHAK